MGKPSIFSKDYEQRMKRRRINITLFILIVISASFFGIRYYLDKNNINIAFKIPWSKITTGENKKDKSENNNEKKEEVPKPEKTDEEEKNNIAFFEYKALDGSIYKIEYNKSIRQITGIKSDASIPLFDISKDNTKIVFEDRLAGDIIVMDIDGAYKKINSDSYNSKSTGIVIRKDEMIKRDPKYIWAAKPHFTMDGGVVFVSRLPYIQGESLYLWYIGTNGNMRLIGKITDNMDNITYEGFTEDNALRINIDNSVYYLPLGVYQLKNQ